MSFASRLKELREGAGFGLRELAREIGVSHAFVCRAEKGRSIPAIVTILDWADALDLPDDTTEELVARRMAERYDLGQSWELWGEPAHRVVMEVQS